MFAELVEEIEQLSEHDLAMRLQELEFARRALDAQLAAVVNVAERHGSFRADGHASVRGWVKALTNCSDADASRYRDLGRVSHHHPTVGDALITGTIGTAQAHVLARVRRNPRCGDQLGDVIDLLVDQASRLPFPDFQLCARRWEMLADTDGAHNNRELNHECRSASVFADECGLHIRASGGNPLDAAEIEEIFDAFRDAEFRNDWDEAVAIHGAKVNSTHLRRTDAQRRFDAVIAIYRAASGATLGDRVCEPTVNIVIDEHTFTTHLAQLLGTDSAAGRLDGLPGQPNSSTTPDPVRSRCETSHGILLHPDDAVRAALIGRVRRVVLDQTGVVIDLGRRQRLFTGNAKDAVLLHAQRCVWPGCRIPAGRCESDHLQPWTAGGLTTPSNGAPACQHHNRWKTRGYTVRRDPHGNWHTYRPDGTELTQPPQAA